MYVTYTNSHFWTDLNQTLHTSLPWSGRDCRVCMDPNVLTSSTFWGLFLGGHCRIMGTRWLLARPLSAIPLHLWFQLVFVWHHQQYVVADGVIRGSLISVILAGVPLTLQTWHRSRRQPPCCIPYSGGCSHHVMDITFNWRQGHPPQRYIPHSSSCFCDLQEIASLQTTVAHSYCKCVALLVMLGHEQDPCVYNSEPHQTGRKRLRNCNYMN